MYYYVLIIFMYFRFVGLGFVGLGFMDLGFMDLGFVGLGLWVQSCGFRVYEVRVYRMS